MITLKGIAKSFGGVRALKGVDLDLVPGEIHGLVGENGAGKSTLMKVLSGAHQPDSGQILIDGRPVRFKGPVQAYAAGVRIVYQELSLVPALTVAENLFLSRFAAGGLRRVDRSALASEAAELLKVWDLDLPPTARIEELTMGKRQLVEIAREISKRGRVLILDEPTSSLTSQESERLFQVLERLKQQDLAIVFISHRLNEVMRVADRVTVLRNGQTVASRPAKGLTTDEMVSLIVGREIGDLFPKAAVTLGEELLAVENLGGPGFEKISFCLRRGEILGLGGLIGAGRSEVLRGLFGLNQIHEGGMRLDGREIAPGHPARAIELGLALLSESRTDEGIFPQLSVGKNIVVMKLKEVARRGWLVAARVRDKVNQAVSALSINTFDAFKQELSQLSGGNQQKVILGRLLAARPKVLLLDEPTRGVDVGTKAEIHRIMGEFVGRGNAIVMVSSDVPELMGMCDRIIVLRQGRMEGEFQREQFREEDILQCQCGWAAETARQAN